METVFGESISARISAISEESRPCLLSQNGTSLRLRRSGERTQRRLRVALEARNTSGAPSVMSTRLALWRGPHHHPFREAHVWPWVARCSPASSPFLRVLFQTRVGATSLLLRSSSRGVFHFGLGWSAVPFLPQPQEAWRRVGRSWPRWKAPLPPRRPR